MTNNSLISPGYAESRKFGIGPDFTIYTGTPKTAGIIQIPEADQSRPIIQMCGSSTVMDLQGDIMALTALQDMTQLDPDFLIFTDHSYDLDNIFGKLYGQPVIQMQNTIADLWLAAEAALDHPPAQRAYNLIVKSKLRLGCSIGCMVLDFEFLEEDDFFSPVIIHHVKCMEFSLVGIPANQRCWIENAIKGLFGRSLVEGNGEEALKLAPAFKGLYPRDYASVVEQITSAGLRKEMQRVPMRSTHPQRILYDFTENREGFVLSDGKSIMKSLSREETADLLKTGAPLHHTTIDETDEAKAATGKTSWPLMDIGTEWTGSKAEKEIFAWAGGDDFSPAKAKQGFLYCDTSAPDVRSSYKLPFCYSGDGGLKIVPLGVRAVANILSGGRGGASLGGDTAAIKSKVKTMYGRINSQFSPDPPWQVPWEKDEKSGEGVLDTQSGNELIRQDLVEEEQVDEDEKTKGVKVSADGSHEPFSGVHTHAHKAYGSQGEDDLHSHEHSHDGDADHGHSHAEKSEEPEKQAGIATDEDGNHKPFTGTHTHAHKAFGGPDDNGDGMHSHEHEHDGDTVHRHSHADQKSTKATVPAANDVKVGSDGSHTACKGVHSHVHASYGVGDGDTHEHDHAHDGDADHGHGHDGVDLKSHIHPHPHEQEVDPVQLAYLAMYNDLGKKLGFPEHNLTTKCSLVATEGDANIVRSMIAALDNCSDEMVQVAQRTDQYVDQIMAMLGVADTDDGGVTPATSPGYYSLQGITTKEGREISAKNAGLIQGIHDACMALHPGVCKGEVSGDGTAHQSEGISVEEARQQAANMGQGQPSEYMNNSLQMLDTLAKSFDNFNVKAVVEATVKQMVSDAMSEARKSLELLNREQRTLLENIAKLKDMPLGRPTHLNRRVVEDDRAATFEEMLEANGIKAISGAAQTLAEALAQTQIVEKSVYMSGQETKSRFRHWPEGCGGPVGKGVRPALTNDQKSFMLPHEWGIYALGGEVDVPLIDDPAEVR